jgi:hypothetical protein
MTAQERTSTTQSRVDRRHFLGAGLVLGAAASLPARAMTQASELWLVPWKAPNLSGR